MKQKGVAAVHILCVGDLCCDLIVPYGKMQQVLQRGDISKEVTDQLQVTMQCGGSVGNVARHLGRLGAHPVFITPLKNDSLGEFLSSEMEKNGVDMHWAAESEKSNMYCVAVLDQTGERTMFCFVPPWADFPRFHEKSFERVLQPCNSDLQKQDILNPEEEILFTSGMAILDDAENNQAVLDFFRARKDGGAKIVFDLNVRAESYGYEGERRRAMEEMISLSDIVLGSGREEFCQVTGREEIRDAAGQLLESGAGTVIARDGGRPILVLETGKPEQEDSDAKYPGTMIPVKPVIPISTLGAGDSFDAMFLSCIAAGAQVTEAVRTASDYAGDYISGKH